MEIVYKSVESLEKPSQVDDTASPNGVYVRKNIVATNVTNPDGTTKVLYTYDEAFLTPEEYRQTDICASYEQSMKNITKRQLLIWLYTHKGATEENIYTAIGTLPTEAQQYLGKVNYSGTNNLLS